MYEKLCETLLHGTDEEIDGIIYRRRQMTAVQVRACTKMLSHACRAPNREERLMEKEIRTHGRFSLLVVLPGWKPDEEKNHVLNG
jgi:hypothetical protein